MPIKSNIVLLVVAQLEIKHRSLRLVLFNYTIYINSKEKKKQRGREGTVGKKEKRIREKEKREKILGFHIEIKHFSMFY